MKFGKFHEVIVFELVLWITYILLGASKGLYNRGSYL